jgi:hypothetical protein
MTHGMRMQEGGFDQVCWQLSCVLQCQWLVAVAGRCGKALVFVTVLGVDRKLGLVLLCCSATGSFCCWPIDNAATVCALGSLVRAKMLRNSRSTPGCKLLAKKVARAYWVWCDRPRRGMVDTC